MPRFYWFTFVAGIMTGLLLMQAYISRSIPLGTSLTITTLLALVLLNEKKAYFEDKLSRRARRLLSLSLCAGLVLLWILSIS